MCVCGGGEIAESATAERVLVVYNELAKSLRALDNMPLAVHTVQPLAPGTIHCFSRPGGGGASRLSPLCVLFRDVCVRLAVRSVAHGGGVSAGAARGARCG